ncbi:hypothetical protein [Priestia megaterium]|uniref:hypothetical protein n=4 Tax=Bacillaceae TaxID=186817 RepID=UPI00211D26DB|nr:hypothetical protein [Priestia megaterium]
MIIVNKYYNKLAYFHNGYMEIVDQVKTTGEFYAHEVTGEKENMGFFVCPSCLVRVHYKKDHFFLREHSASCTYVKGQLDKKYR